MIFFGFFLKFQRKPGIFNTKSICYSVSLQTDLKMKFLKKKYIFVFFEIKERFFEFFLEYLEKNHVFLILGPT